MNLNIPFKKERFAMTKIKQNRLLKYLGNGHIIGTNAYYETMTILKGSHGVVLVSLFRNALLTSKKGHKFIEWYRLGVRQQELW